MTKLVQFSINEEEQQMVETLKPMAKTKTNSKTFKFCLKKAYEIYKDVKS